jgi:hypothetical protein
MKEPKVIGKIDRCAVLEDGTCCKQCRRCEKTYLAKDMQDHFYLDRQRPDGFRGNCISCDKEIQRLRSKVPNYGFLKREKDPKKSRARGLLNNAVSRGKITKPSLCSSCGKEGKIHGHHTDYLKPLEVMWLCPKCHVRQHRIEENREIVPRMNSKQIKKVYERKLIRRSSVTHCPYGHSYSGNNLGIDKKGKRICRSCSWYRARELEIKSDIPEKYL